MHAPWLVPCLAMTLAAQAPQALHAPITRVRLHPDEAWVTRTGSAKVAGGGLHRFLLKDLLPGLTLDDVRVEARGPQGSRLGDLSLGSEPRKVTETADYQELKAAVEAQRDKVDALEAEGDALAREQTFLAGLQGAYDKEISSRLTASLPQAESVVALSRGLETRMAEGLQRDRKRRHEHDAARAELRRLEAELARRAAERTASPSQAVVEVATPGPGTVEVELTYRTRRARWDPAYEARLAQGGGGLELALFATVKQDSGEDWDGVKVEVTNARSARSLEIAHFDGPAELGFEPPAPPPPVSKMARYAAADRVQQNAFAPGAPPSAAAVVEVSAGIAAPQEAAALEEAQGIASTWSLEGTKDIPSDREPHRFRMLGREIEPTLALVATPRLDPTVMRVARFPMPQGIPLFPGAPVVHFAGTQRVGQAPLEVPAPGTPFRFSFGPYRGLRVELRRVDVKKEAVGAFTKETQWTLRERLEVANDTAQAVQVELQDRELKASDDKVKVTVLPDSTPSREGEVPGVRAWTLQVPAGGRGAVVLGTQIRIPAAGSLSGAEGLNLP